MSYELTKEDHKLLSSHLRGLYKEKKAEVDAVVKSLKRTAPYQEAQAKVKKAKARTEEARKKYQALNVKAKEPFLDAQGGHLEYSYPSYGKDSYSDTISTNIYDEVIRAIKANCKSSKLRYRDYERIVKDLIKREGERIGVTTAEQEWRDMTRRERNAEHDLEQVEWTAKKQQRQVERLVAFARDHEWTVENWVEQEAKRTREDDRVKERQLVRGEAFLKKVELDLGVA